MKCTYVLARLIPTILIILLVPLFSSAQYQITQKGSDIDGETSGDQSGYSVSMPSGNTVAIGALDNNGNGTASGHVRVYKWSGSSWVQKGNDIDGEAFGDWSGYSVSMPDDNTLAIGAILNNGNGSDAGHVRVYYWNGSSWTQEGNDIDGEVTGDYSGWSVSMSDSKTVAIAAPFNDNNGFDAGVVRVYYLIGSGWIQKGNDIYGEVAGDNSGHSVSMPDSNTIAISGIENDSSGSASGHVRIFK